MFTKIARAVCGVALAFVLTPGGRLLAQDAVLNELYGSGVHQYFAGNYAQAASDLTAAIDGGSKDPRAYYFRALADLRLGWQQNAKSDFQTGAALESADINQFYPVAKSLERVQGSARLALERYRAVARAEAHQRQERRNAIRYEQRKRAEVQVLRAPAPAPLPAPLTVKPSLAAEEPAAVEDPFAEKEDKAESADEMPAEEKPAAKEGDDDPFADPAAKEDAADKKPEAEEEMSAEDAGDKDADAKSDKAGEDNPFGDDSDGKAP
ncbi:MAG: hypothetical protein HY288_11780 [Planctomycetia bacterium]|nr:hypothetical protein [Planctomycetia bacterium]